MKPQEVLQSHDLKRTACREGILSVMLDSGQALSENEIRDELDANFDRTTFYRSFKTLLEKSIIHKIVVDNQVIKYAIDNSVTFKNKHAHFYCRKCDTVFCLDDVPFNEPEIPQGYQASETDVIIKGMCRICNS
jgi:Fur family transcriptional regulator, ferric uptake regulator